MSIFNGAVLTRKGNELLVTAAAGRKIEFTKLVTGSGIYSEEQRSRAALELATGLKQQRQEFSFSKYEKVSEKSVLLTALITNKELSEGYKITEIGVYGKVAGESEEFLCSIATTNSLEESDSFPPYNGLRECQIIQDYYITISPDAEVVINSQGAVALLEDLEKHKSEIKALIEDLRSLIGELSRLKTENKNTIVDAINELVEIVRPLHEYSMATDQDIDDILEGVYTEDTDGVSMLDIASNQDIDEIIAEEYEESMEPEEENAASDADIDAIIDGTYVEEAEEEEEDVDAEITKIIEGTFGGSE